MKIDLRGDMNAAIPVIRDENTDHRIKSADNYNFTICTIWATMLQFSI